MNSTSSHLNSDSCNTSINFCNSSLVNTSCTSNQTTNSTATNLTIVELSAEFKVFMFTFYSLMFVSGITGNLAVIYLFGIKRKVGRGFDVYIVSLAVADLLLALLSPVVTIHDLVTNLKSWKLLGGFGCKVFLSIDHVTMLVSASMLIIISLERIRFIKSDKKVIFSKKKAYVKIGSAWMLAFCVVSPYMYALQVEQGYCWTWGWQSIQVYIYYMVYISLSCFLPAIILFIIYAISACLLSAKVKSQSKDSIFTEKQRHFKRLSKVVVLISLVFFMLTMPNAIYHFVFMYYGTFEDIHEQQRKTYQTLSYVCHTLSHCNSFINPFIYAGMQKTLKKMVRDAGDKSKTLLVSYTTKRKSQKTFVKSESTNLTAQ